MKSARKSPGTQLYEEEVGTSDGISMGQPANRCLMSFDVWASRLLEDKKVQPTRDDFEYWLFEMDERLSSFFGTLPESVSEKLDYSLGSLSVLEKWLLAKYPSVNDIMKPSEKDTLDNASRYVGEAFRKTLGGIWNIELKDKDNAYFKMPVVQNTEWTECPITLVIAATDRRKGSFIEGVLKSYVEQFVKLK